MMLSRFLSFIIAISFSLAGYGQIHDPVKWRYKLNDLGNDKYELVFEAKIDAGWNTYSIYTEDNGPVPTSINFEPETGFKTIGKAEEIGNKKKGKDKLFDNVIVTKFLSGQPYIIKQKVKADKGTNVISGYLEYMVCNDEMCLPPTDFEFNFNLNNTVTQDVQVLEDADKDKVLSEENSQQIEEPVKWNFDIDKLDETTYKLTFTSTQEDGWYVYSKYTPDGGPIPTEIVFESDTSGFKLIGDAKEYGDRKEGPDPLFDNIEVIKYSSKKPFTIEQIIKIKDLENLKGYLSFMTCNDVRCLPPEYIDFNFDITNLTAGQVELDATGQNLLGDSTNVLDQKIPTLQASYADPVGDCPGGEESGNRTLFWSFIFGFLGGLLALLTPCVFPMIPLTVSFFTKDTKRKGWVNGMIYALSIIVIYLVLGLAITAVFGDEALNRLSTNWIANTLFFLIFLAFAFSFFGYYEITLPSSWSTKSDSMADKGGLIGIFFMAFTLALVSFSCTGPIIGSAIVQAASNQVGPAIVMFGFALALALPFGLFAAFPAWLNTLPQSGGWMNSVKVVLGFLELALAFKFLSVADMTNHWGFLKYELFMGIWIIIFAMMTLYLFGKIKFPHDSPIRKLSPVRLTLAMLSAVFTIYLATGFMTNPKTGNYNSLGLMSGLAPPAHYNFFKPPAAVDPAIKAEYPSYTMCANNIPCFKDYYEGLAYAKKVNRPVFKDFTGYGCVNCRKTEEHIWIDDRIRDKLINDFVLVSLYVDDDKELDTVMISKQRKKKIRNVGNKWADFQIINYEQNSQPLYVMMTPDQEVLAKPRGYREGIKEYEDYLDCGLATFNNLQSEQ